MEELWRQQREELLDVACSLPRTTTQPQVRSVSTHGTSPSGDGRRRASGSSVRTEGQKSSKLDARSSVPCVRPKARTSMGPLGIQAPAVSRGGEPRLDLSSGLPACIYCSGGHSLDQCLKFGGYFPEQKLAFLRERGVCFACLKRGHMGKDCKNRLSCAKCMQTHPTVLHRQSTEELIADAMDVLSKLGKI